MNWLVYTVVPVVAFFLLWLLAAIGEEKWQETISDEEWEE